MTSETTVDSDSPSDPNSMGVSFAPKSFQYSSVASTLTENNHYVTVAAVGAKFLYVIPGFDVLATEMRHIQTKGTSFIGSQEDTYDLFIKNDHSLSRAYPCLMLLQDFTVIKVNIHTMRPQMLSSDVTIKL